MQLENSRCIFEKEIIGLGDGLYVGTGNRMESD